MNDNTHHRRSTYSVLFISLWITLMVLVVKLWLGWATQSLSLLAESLHTLLDSLSTLLSLVALSSHNRLGWHNVWSHSKREMMGLMIVVAFLGFSGCSLLIMAAQALETADLAALYLSPKAMQMLGFIILVTFSLAIFKRHRGYVITSSVLRLNAQHTLRDAWLTVLVFLGLVGVHLGYSWLDAVATIILVLALAGSAWQLVHWQLPLMVEQVAIAPEVLVQMAKQVEGVSHCHRAHARGLVGRQVFVELYLGVHPEFMGVARTIAQRIEAMIRTRYGPVKVSIFIDSETAAGSPPLNQNVMRPPLYPPDGSDVPWN